MTLTTLIILSALAFPRQFPDVPMPPQFPEESVVAKIGSCGLAGCDCGCVEGGLCTCRPDRPAVDSFGMKRLPATYAGWKASIKKRANPNPGLAPRPTVFAPVLFPVFRAGAPVPCRGGG